jgi:hypothetical protein
MKKIVLILICTIVIVGVSSMYGQQLNGQPFTFKKGKTEWSDTIYKKLLTKKMAKDGQKSVLLAIRYKFESNTNEGKWYQIEITNRSKDTKVKFNISSSHNQETFAVKLNPSQTKTIRKLYYRARTGEGYDALETEADYIISPFEEILDNRR